MKRDQPTDTERGAVLLTTLLIMSLMAILAVSMLDDVRFAVKRTINVQAYTQADWYIHSTEDYAETYLKDLISDLSPEQLNLVLSNDQTSSFPVDGGAILISLRDGSQCLSLGLLSNGAGARQFRQLMVALGVFENDAAVLTSKIIDWQDTDTETLPNGAEDFAYLNREPPYRTSNTYFRDVQGLRAVDTLSEDIFQALQPFVCARSPDAGIGININTLRPEHAPVLAAVLGGDRALETALRIIQERPADGYKSLETFLASDTLNGQDTSEANFDLLVFAPQHIYIETIVTLGEINRQAAFEFELTGGNIVLRSRAYGPDAVRPIAVMAEP